MKNVLVIYYSQSGQLNRAVKATLTSFEKDETVKVYYEQIKPVNPYPFPWTYMQFFDAFPESVQGIPCDLEKYAFDTTINYDLIIIAYQPWFLSVSIPVNSFLMSQEAQKLFKDKKVVTIIACRNMWLNAQEKMKLTLNKLQTHLVGNITFVDKSSNLTSLITVLAFALKGIQGKFMGIFPKYGVSDKDLRESAPKFGELLLLHLRSGDYGTLQRELAEAGAINIKPNLMFMEGRGKILFPLYAGFVSKKGVHGSKERRNRVRIFGIALPMAILILSPIITIVSRLTPLIFAKRAQKEIDYYSQNSLR